MKQAHYGTEAQRKARWCGLCGKQHMAIRLTKNTMCEDCSVKQASFGNEDERKARWCGPCGGSHGAIRLSKHAMGLKYARKAARKSGNEA